MLYLLSVVTVILLPFVYGELITSIFMVIKSLICKNSVTPVIFSCHVMLSESSVVFLRTFHSLIFDV